MAIIASSILAITIALLVIGRDKGWGYAPASLLSLLFVVPIAMLVFGWL